MQPSAKIWTWDCFIMRKSWCRFSRTITPSMLHWFLPCFVSCCAHLQMELFNAVCSSLLVEQLSLLLLYVYILLPNPELLIPRANSTIYSNLNPRMEGHSWQHSNIESWWVDGWKRQDFVINCAKLLVFIFLLLLLNLSSGGPCGICMPSLCRCTSDPRR